MVQHLTFYLKLTYNTVSNKTRLFLTPGYRIICLYIYAPTSVCGMYSSRLQGVHAARPKVLMRLSKMKNHVRRACGVSTGTNCVHDRIQCEFLTEK
uniref:60S ribosomal protein L34-like n=1 Tax=Arvicanthis niloticus TaxID=61156 RepID=UPI001486EE57|nr:60S ribosomal protein L34-like [Arvicanthis niloticus]